VQFDIKTTFIYGDIFEELYIGQTKGFEDFLSPHKMYKLQKSISRLRQALCNWNQKFNEFLVGEGLVPITMCLYMSNLPPSSFWTYL
jgi:hypothetical protein